MLEKTHIIESHIFTPQPLRGGLYLVATPIGNLFDITLRALNTLISVDHILCEDKRVSLKLLNHYNIKTHLISYHDHNAKKVLPKIILLLQEKHSIALISDAGTPLLSDPGYKLVQIALEHDIHITTIPGASALLAGLPLSGLPMNNFYFAGFLTTKKNKRISYLNDLREVNASLIFYESPKRILDSLKDMYRTLGDRRITLARELTKLYEEVIRAPLSNTIKQIEDGQVTLKGEFVIMVEGFKATKVSNKKLSEILSAEILSTKLAKNSTKDVCALIAKKYGISKKRAYTEVLSIKNKRQSKTET